MSLNRSSDEIDDIPSDLSKTTDKVLEVFKTYEENAQALDKRKQSLEKETAIQKRNLIQMELEKSALEDEITMLKIRNLSYQKEHTSLRNTITVIKFQIEKIKDSIMRAKASELKELEEFEKAVDKITEKFRSSPNIYDRKVILEKIEKERERKDFLAKKLGDIKKTFEEFSSQKGLRVRENESEELFDCVLPGSTLYSLIEMTENLEEVTCVIKKLNRSVKECTENLENMDVALVNLHTKCPIQTSLAGVLKFPEHDEEWSSSRT